MEKRTFLLSLILLVFIAGLASAQATGVTITTNPPGAEVMLIGEATVTGVSPVTFRQGIIGRYKLICSRSGYETYSTYVVADPTQAQSVDITLSPKTRYKAAARSLFIPGWGQRYGNQGTKGFLFQLGIVGAGVAYLILDHDFDWKFDEYKTAQADYAAATTYAEQERTWERLQYTQKRAYDAEETRRLTIGIGVGIWALNFLDALLFFPENRETFSYKGLSLTPDTQNERMGFALTARF